MADEAPSRVPEDLQQLRERLYARDATAADHARYAEELTRREREPAEADGERADRQDEPRKPAESARGRSRLLVASTVALVAGLALGVLVMGEATRFTTASPFRDASSSPAKALPVPLPLPADALGTKAERQADAQVLDRALLLPTATAKANAMLSVGTTTALRLDSAWLERTGCSTWSGVRNVSVTGSRANLRSGARTSRPYGSHFRVKIFLTEATGWSWTALGRTDGGSEGVVALGAGGSGSGSSQFVEFDTQTPTTITSVDVRPTPAQPFVWELDYCTPA